MATFLANSGYEYTKNKVVVVIPVFQSELSSTENLCLQQCLRVLGRYSIHVVMPKLLATPAWITENNLQEIRFDDAFFESVQAYNHLMVSVEFYRAFANFDYILIHQLDAYVFKDDLLYWCNQGYDYIGAAWLKEQDFENICQELWFNAKKKIAIWLNLKKQDGITPREIQLMDSVGNGGFSLRKVQKFTELIPEFSSIIEQYMAQNKHQFNEDVFWGVEVNRYVRHLNIPNWQTALRFSVEFFPEKAYYFSGGKLPFGCHAFEKHNPEFWKRFIPFAKS